MGLLASYPCHTHAASLPHVWLAWHLFGSSFVLHLPSHITLSLTVHVPSVTPTRRSGGGGAEMRSGSEEVRSGSEEAEELGTHRRRGRWRRGDEGEKLTSGRLGLPPDTEGAVFKCEREQPAVRRRQRRPERELGGYWACMYSAC